MPVSIENFVDRKIESGTELIANPNYLEELNDYLSKLEPKYILEWVIDHLPNLYQTTAFGVS